MKMRYYFLILLVSLACVFAVADMTAAGNALAAALNMSVNIVEGERYHWNTPRELLVSNEQFRVSRLFQDEDVYMFSLSTSGNVTVATCVVGETLFRREARCRLCDHLVAGVTMPVNEYAANFRAELGSNDCFRIVQRAGGNSSEGAFRHSVAYGNLYLDVQVRTNVTVFTARNFADALIVNGIRVPCCPDQER